MKIEPKPRFKHDCDRCAFLGHHNDADLYYCSAGCTLTVIARWSSKPSDYTSGLVEGGAQPELQVAAVRAVKHLQGKLDAIHRATARENHQFGQ